jgi:hypothetical protein
MPLDKVETFAFLKLCSEVGVLDVLMDAISRPGSGLAEQPAREPGTRYLEDARLTLATLDLDEVNELMEAAGPLIKYLISEPEMVRRIMDTSIVQRKLQSRSGLVSA